METSFDLLSGEAAAAFVRDYLAAWNSRDPARLLALTQPDVEWEDPSLPGGHVQTREPVRRWLEATWLAVPDLTFALDGEVHVAADGTSLMCRWRASGTMTGPLGPQGYAATNGRVEFAGADLHRYREGRLAQVWATYDTAAIARQIGAAPRPGTFAERAGVLLQRAAAMRARRRHGR